MQKKTFAEAMFAASLVAFAGTASLAQQAGGSLQPQTVPTTPGGIPPAEITPAHPLDNTTGPRTGTSTGAAHANSKEQYQSTGY
jgi:hypothetical protein